MGSLHHLPMAASTQARLLEQLVSEAIAAHPDKEVANAWASMARESIRRYAGPPMPSQPLLDLDSINGLDATQREQLQILVGGWLESYFNDVRHQLMDIHRDFMSLQKRVAELQAQQQEP